MSRIREIVGHRNGKSINIRIDKGISDSAGILTGDKVSISIDSQEKLCVIEKAYDNIKKWKGVVTVSKPPGQSSMKNVIIRASAVDSYINLFSFRLAILETENLLRNIMFSDGRISFRIPDHFLPDATPIKTQEKKTAVDEKQLTYLEIGKGIMKVISGLKSRIKDLEIERIELYAEMESMEKEFAMKEVGYQNRIRELSEKALQQNGNSGITVKEIMKRA